MHARVHHCKHEYAGVHCVTVGLLAAFLVPASACKWHSRESRERRERRKGGGKEKEMAQIDDYLLAHAAFAT